MLHLIRDMGLNRTV